MRVKIPGWIPWVGTKEGYAFHVHHDLLWEYCHGYRERVRFIREVKSADEIETRLRLFRLIPTNKVIEKYKAARDEVDQTQIALNKVSYSEPEWQGLFSVLEKAKQKKASVREELAVDMTKRHKELCPDCPWNGYTIFP